MEEASWPVQRRKIMEDSTRTLIAGRTISGIGQLDWNEIT